MARSVVEWNFHRPQIGRFNHGYTPKLICVSSVGTLACTLTIDTPNCEDQRYRMQHPCRGHLLRWPFWSAAARRRFAFRPLSEAALFDGTLAFPPANPS